jgi:hypothetical protein
MASVGGGTCRDAWYQSFKVKIIKLKIMSNEKPDVINESKPVGRYRNLVNFAPLQNK